jgi:hypothetical protein
MKSLINLGKTLSKMLRLPIKFKKPIAKWELNKGKHLKKVPYLSLKMTIPGLNPTLSFNLKSLRQLKIWLTISNSYIMQAF